MARWDFKILSSHAKPEDLDKAIIAIINGRPVTKKEINVQNEKGLAKISLMHFTN